MKKNVIFLAIAVLLALSAGAKTQKLRFMQLNVWVECNNVPGAMQYLVDAVDSIRPDIATFCELYKGDDENPAIPYLVAEMQKRGVHYYSARVDGRAVISRYPIKSSTRIDKWMARMVLDIDGRQLVVCPAHSEYRWYGCYLPRGMGDGGDRSWDVMPAPITNVDTIEAVNLKSGRLESVKAFCASVDSLRKAGVPVIMAGDLNEPSHLDWTEATGNMFQHQGCVVHWQDSWHLLHNGYRDAYRDIYPDPVKSPGITWPASNLEAPVSKLSWNSVADERDRIDFVYYTPGLGLKPVAAAVAGPRGSVAYGRRTYEHSLDRFIPFSHWPSDHKAVVIDFELK